MEILYTGIDTNRIKSTYAFGKTAKRSRYSNTAVIHAQKLEIHQENLL